MIDKKEATPQTNQQKNAKKTTKTNNMPVKIKYEMNSALYANQFIINQSKEEVFIDFSSGAIPDPATGQTLIPIHTRIAITYENAKRLSHLLTQAIQRHSSKESS